MNGLAVEWRSQLRPEGCEQRESKVVGALEVYAKALQVSKHYSMPRFGFRAFFWIGSMDC